MADNYKISLKKEVAHASYTVGVSNFDLHTLWHIFSPSHFSLNFLKLFLPSSNLSLRALFLGQHLAKMMQNVDLRFLTARDNFNFKNWCGFSCYADQTFFARAQSHQEGVRPPKVILILFFSEKKKIVFGVRSANPSYASKLLLKLVEIKDYFIWARHSASNKKSRLN